MLCLTIVLCHMLRCNCISGVVGGDARADVSLGERVGLEEGHVASAASLLSNLTHDAAALGTLALLDPVRLTTNFHRVA